MVLRVLPHPLHLSEWCMCDHKPTAVTPPYHSVLGFPLRLPKCIWAMHSSGEGGHVFEAIHPAAAWLKSQGEAQRKPAYTRVSSPPVLHFSTSLWGTLCRMSGWLWNPQLRLRCCHWSPTRAQQQTTGWRQKTVTLCPSF